jgi:hypothetical protein
MTTSTNKKTCVRIKIAGLSSANCDRGIKIRSTIKCGGLSIANHNRAIHSVY